MSDFWDGDLDQDTGYGLYSATEGHHTAFAVVAGSHAYGTNRPDSDIDVRGVYIAETADLFRLRPPRESIVRSSPDITVFELRKFAALAAAANPNVLEMLWAPLLEQSMYGAMLRANRRLFLSRLARKTYGGYAISQLRRAIDGTGGSRGQAHMKREKFMLHLFRLLEQGTTLLQAGDLSLRVEDPEALWARASWPIERVQSEFLRLDAEMASAVEGSSLPDVPDYERIDQMLIDIRQGMEL